MKLPLDGIIVLDIGTLTPGKFCTSLLADMGASVLRIERPSASSSAISREDLALNRNKRSLALDLRAGAGTEILLRLAQRCDAVIESYRPGVTKRLGIDYVSLSARNPRLVYCSLSGFGQTGPLANRPGYDLLFVAQSGLLSAIAGSGRAPSVPGAYLSDAVSGITAALAICAALVETQKTGKGRYVDLAMLDCAFALLSVSHGVLSDATGAEGDAYASPFYGIYETADGRYLALGAIRAESSRALCDELGRPEMAKKGFGNPQQRAAVSTFLSETFKRAPASEWLSRLSALDVEIAPVNAPHEAFADPQLVARRMAPEDFHPAAGRFKRIATPVRFFAERSDSVPAPRVGQNSQQVLLELGYSEAEIKRLREQSVI
jgi:crotonobetainyl-CoA:carnitine CoA-transferase CaiB-like acyl-CoA transferase